MIITDQPASPANHEGPNPPSTLGDSNHPGPFMSCESLEMCWLGCRWLAEGSKSHDTPLEWRARPCKSMK